MKSDSKDSPSGCSHDGGAELRGELRANTNSRGYDWYLSPVMLNSMKFTFRTFCLHRGKDAF